MADAQQHPSITIPKKRSRAVSIAVAASLIVASLGVGFAVGRLTAPAFPGGNVPTLPGGGFPSGQFPNGGAPGGGFPGEGAPSGGGPAE